MRDQIRTNENEGVNLCGRYRMFRTQGRDSPTILAYAISKILSLARKFNFQQGAIIFTLIHIAVQLQRVETLAVTSKADSAEGEKKKIHSQGKH